MEEEKETVIEQLIKKIEMIEKQIKELEKRQKLLQEAFYKMYEDQRRRERML